MVQNCFTLKSQFLFNVHTVNCMQYSERICCNSTIKLDRSLPQVRHAFLRGAGTRDKPLGTSAWAANPVAVTQ